MFRASRPANRRGSPGTIPPNVAPYMEDGPATKLIGDLGQLAVGNTTYVAIGAREQLARTLYWYLERELEMVFAFAVHRRAQRR